MIEPQELQLRNTFFLMKRKTRRLKRLALALVFLDILGFLALRLLSDYERFIF